MAFLFWKRFKTISDLRTADLKLKKVRRSDVKLRSSMMSQLR